MHEGVAARQMEKRGVTSNRCEINKGIKERNKLLMKIKQLANEITAYIIGKAREIIGRFEKLRGCDRSFERPGGNAGLVGDAAGRNRGADQGEREPKGATGRISSLKRNAEQSSGEIEGHYAETVGTDSEIEGTDQRIEELKGLKIRKELDRDERLRKLKQRQNGRASDHTGGTGGRDRQVDGRKSETEITGIRGVRVETESLQSFLRDCMDQRRSEGKRGVEAGRKGEVGVGFEDDAKAGLGQDAANSDIGRRGQNYQGSKLSL